LNPNISVIVPVYNSETYINQCIDSILNQTFSNFELILVDDFSQDNSPKICDDYSKKDKRINIIHKNKNEGSSLARKTGLNFATGDYIQFVDSDDWIEPDMLEKLYQKAVVENNDLVICNVYYFENNKKDIIKQDFSKSDKISLIKNIIAIKSKAYLFNKLIKRDLLSIVNFPEDSRSEDYVITVQNIYNSQSIGFINDPLYNYRYNSLSLSNNEETKLRGLLEENKNWRLLLLYLKEKYNNLSIFEPELGARLNSFRYLYNKYNIPELNELFKIYQGKYYFFYKIKREIKLFIKKILYLIMKN